jgi:hypothetical protein
MPATVYEMVEQELLRSEINRLKQALSSKHDLCESQQKEIVNLNQEVQKASVLAKYGHCTALILTLKSSD